MTWVFILTLKNLYGIQSFKLTNFPPGNIEFYHNSAKFSGILKHKKKYDLSFNLLNYSSHQNLVLLIPDSFWFHQWPGYYKAKQTLLLLILLWEVWTLSQEIGLVHELDWPDCLDTKMLTGYLLSQLCCFLIFSSVCLFTCPYSFPD